jgi:hypothetical protein
MCMGLGHDCGLSLTCPLSGCTGLIYGQKSSDSFLAVWPKFFSPVFQRPTTIGVDDVYFPRVSTLIVIVSGWP